MLSIIPVLEVEETCNYCEPQQCFTASVRWGDCLLSFYTKDASRLEPERLNETACEVLQQLTKACRPGQETVIEPEDLWKLIGNAGCLPCFWSDWRPPVAIAYSLHCCIPVKETEA